MIIHLPTFNPNLFEIGPIAIRYYSLAYILGILSAVFFVNWQNKKHNFMSKKAEDDFLMWAVLSIILGGRLGYVLFYNFGYFLHHPLEIFAVWQGGMSFHGGLLGSIFGLWLFCRVHKINFLQIADILCVVAPIGIFLGRVANFINLELYGRPTNGDFGFIFPSDPLLLPRHASQLYEGLSEGLLTFIILFCLMQFSKIQDKKGALSGIFLILYGISRILVENFREPDIQLGLFFNTVTMGQILSLPLFALGFWLVFRGKNQNSQI
jgi:phosphatidylglycerol:prolipoprotein diacylglycerol transferase